MMMNKVSFSIFRLPFVIAIVLIMFGAACSSSRMSTLAKAKDYPLPAGVEFDGVLTTEGNVRTGRGLISVDRKYFAIPTRFIGVEPIRDGSSAVEIFNLETRKHVANAYDRDSVNYSGGVAIEVDEPFIHHDGSLGLLIGRYRSDRTKDLCILRGEFSERFTREEFCIDESGSGPKFRTIINRITSSDGRYVLIVGTSLLAGFEPSMSTIRPAYKVLDLVEQKIVSSGHSLDQFNLIPFSVGASFFDQAEPRLVLGVGHAENFTKHRFEPSARKFALVTQTIEGERLDETPWGTMLEPRGAFHILDQSESGAIAWMHGVCLEFTPDYNCLSAERSIYISPPVAQNTLPKFVPNDEELLVRGVWGPNHAAPQFPTYHGHFLSDDIFVAEFESHNLGADYQPNYSKIYSNSNGMWSASAGRVPGVLLAASSDGEPKTIFTLGERLRDNGLQIRVFEYGE